MIKAKDGRLIFDNVKDLNAEINRRIKPQIDNEIENLHKRYDEQIENAKIQATKDASTMMLPVIATKFGSGQGPQIICRTDKYSIELKINTSPTISPHFLYRLHFVQE